MYMLSENVAINIEILWYLKTRYVHTEVARDRFICLKKKFYKLYFNILIAS